MHCGCERSDAVKQRFAPAASGGWPSAIFFRWLGWMLALNVAWEIAQMPLYKLPPAPFSFYTVYSIAHCSIGDMLIATAVYFGAALAAGWHWPIDAPLRGLSALLPLAVAYTAYSEWRNVYVTGSWGYDTAMPMVFGLGLAPLAQWLAIPPIAVFLVRRGLRR
jgi:hypothetical protein